MRTISMPGVLVVLVVSTSLLLSGVSDAGSTLSDPDDFEPDTTEAESDDESGSDECMCECFREPPPLPPSPEIGEDEAPETDTAEEEETVIE